jgi:hypothetical protein
VKVIKVQAEIKIPSVPNFFIREDGHSIPISAVTDEDLKMIGDLWTKELIEKAQAKRKKKY